MPAPASTGLSRLLSITFDVKTAGEDEPSSPDPPSFIVPACCFVLLAALLGMHLALLPQGQWFDEYFTFSFLRSWGWAGVAVRLQHWGMRPISEVLAFGYCRLVLLARQPLIWECLAFCWLVLFGLLALAIAPWRGPARSARCIVLLALPLLFLVSAPVGELWYWPLGALAYLPALGAAAYATMVLVGPGLRRDRDWIVLALVLTIAAFSSELGAFFALLLSPLLFGDLFVRQEPGGIRQAAVIGVPFMAAGFVMASLMHGRAASQTEMMAAGSFHHALPSLLRALPHALAGLSGWGDTGWQTLRALLSRAVLVAGSAGVLRCAWPAPVPRARVALVLVALAGTALLSIAGAFYQFGVLCCERHEAYRQALYVLMVAASAGLLPRRVRWPAGWRMADLSVALVTVAVTVAALPRVPALLAEYRDAHAQRKALKALFASGNDKATDTVTMILAPPGPLFQTYHIPPGQYSMTPTTPWYVQGPMLFFGKTRLVAIAPK
jgi:hypothetical protein